MKILLSSYLNIHFFKSYIFIFGTAVKKAMV